MAGEKQITYSDWLLGVMIKHGADNLFQHKDVDLYFHKAYGYNHFAPVREDGEAFKKYQIEAAFSGFGAAPVRAEGQPVDYDYRWVHIIGYKLTPTAMKYLERKREHTI